MLFNNYTFLNSTNFSSLNCTTPQYFASFSDFLDCYNLLISENVLAATGQIILGVLTALLCVPVSALLIIKQSKNIFDDILFGHCEFIKLLLILIK
jgi:hypothetical protein